MLSYIHLMKLQSVHVSRMIMQLIEPGNYIFVDYDNSKKFNFYKNDCFFSITYRSLCRFVNYTVLKFPGETSCFSSVEMS